MFINQIEGLTLYFENMESADIKGAHIGHLDIAGVTREIRRCACNSFSDHLTCKSFAIEINKYADTLCLSVEPETGLFDRVLSSNDITEIKLEYKGKETSILLPWHGEYENRNQTSAVANNGHLYIVADERLTVTDVFEEKWESYIDWPWMCMWEKKPGGFTPGGDPFYVCPICGKGGHVNGVESPQRLFRCPNCSTILTYP